MLASLAGRVAFITGASRGIGRSTAQVLAEEGCSVALVARSKEGLEQTAERCREYKVPALVIPGDITNPEALQSAIDRTVRELGGLQILINNAGLGYVENVSQADPEEWEKVLALNLHAGMEATRRCLPHMKQYGSGAIIFISSISGKITYEGGSAYCASKHGILGFAGSVFEEVRRYGIKVCSICPGYVDTNMLDGLLISRAGMLLPEDVAETVRFALKLPANACPTEIVLRALGTG